MALDVYFKEDIKNALRAIEHSTQQALTADEMTDHQKGYQKGFNAALASIALAFGLMEDK